MRKEDSLRVKNLLAAFPAAAALAILLLSCGSDSGGSPAQNTQPQQDGGSPSAPAPVLSGTLAINEMASGTDRNWWERGALLIYSDNSVSKTTLDSYGASEISSGTIVSSGGGFVIMTGGAETECFCDSGNTIFHGPTSHGEAAGIFTALRKAGEYSAPELEGAWKVNILISGPSAPWWERGALTVDSSGDFTASTADMYGDPGYLNFGGTLGLSTEGRVSMPIFPTLEGVMDADKTVIVWTDTWSDGSTELAVLTRQADSYSASDFEGIWRLSSLETGAVSGTANGTASISADGTASIEYSSSDGGNGTVERSFQITSDGIITIDGFPDTVGGMDSGKSVMVFTETLIAFDKALSNIIVFTKN